MSETKPAREEALHAFVEASDWRGGSFHPLPGDASTRRYIRVAKNGKNAILMDQPQHAEAPTAARDATPEERRKLGYNAVARLAGADCSRFVAVADHLRRAGLAAPEIYLADTRSGFLLMEDFGDNLYSDALNGGADEAGLYAAAIDALAALHSEAAPAQIGPLPFFDYDETALLAETDLLTEWFLPMALGRPASEDERTEHRSLWQALLAPVLNAERVFVHRDFHAQNLIWMPERAGVARVGLVDIQDAVAGHPAYDLISLVEDARRDVSPELSEAMTARYLEHGPSRMSAEAFRAAAAVLAAQRNAKIIGIFARLAKRDGKTRYLDHLPRVWRYMERDLDHSSLARLKAWYDRVIAREARIAAYGI